MFSQILNKIKEMIYGMLGMNKTIEQTLHIVPAVSNKMAEAIDEWTQMYEDKAEWLHEPTYNDPSMVVSLGLPAFIASEKARMAVIELRSEITAPKETVTEENPEYFPPTSDMFGNVKVSGKPKTIITEKTIGTTERAEYMNEQYKNKLLSRIRTQLEYGIAKGSLIIKPYVRKYTLQDVAGLGENEQIGEAEIKYDIEFDFVQADCFYPFAFDSSGKLTEVAFIQTKVDKDKVYTRLEYHKLENNNVTIINRAFESLNDASNTAVPNHLQMSLGKEIELSKVAEWSTLPPQATIKNVDRLLFGYFKMPDANTIDPHSPLGISGFARAKTLIREADKQYSRLLWEFQGGELAIDIDRDALQFMQGEDGKGHSVMGQLQSRLYRTIDLGESDTYKPFSPQLRDNSLINGLNAILMRIEDVCAMSRGTISNVANEARTATELKILRQRSYSSNAEIQFALETALRDVVYAMNIYCTLYNIVGDVPRDANGRVDVSKMGAYDVSFTWDDSILVDVETELQKRLTLMNNGLTSKQEVRMWYYNESARQAREALDRITEESQQAIEQNMIVSSQLGKQIGGSKNPEGAEPKNEPNSNAQNGTEIE